MTTENTQHTHNFVLFNIQGNENATDDLEHLQLKVKPGQGAAMTRRAVHLYLTQYGAMKVQAGSSLYVFPKAYTEQIDELRNWIVMNDGSFVIFQACGSLDDIAFALSEQFDELIEQYDQVVTKAANQKRNGKALEQIEEIAKMLQWNERFLFPEHKENINKIEDRIDGLNA